MQMWGFLLKMHPEWIAAWVMSAIVYYLLLFTYACRIKPEADLHSAVAYGDVEGLRALLCDSELVLDVNRYGPNGRTPLHLASLRGRIDCMRVLIEQNADLEARTADRLRNTALHLASMGHHPPAVRFLCQVAMDTDSALVNLGNADGDTALHLAAQRQNVGASEELLKTPGISVKVRNNKRQTPSECAPSEKFGFDRNSPESAIAELLRNAEAGVVPRDKRAGSCELSTITSSSSSSPSASARSSAVSPAVASSSAPPHRDSADRRSVQETSNGHGAQHAVPLSMVSEAAEREFMNRHHVRGSSTESKMTVQITNCGISSFMLSAGMGAVSRAFLSTIEEESSTPAASSGGSVVKATSFEDFTELKLLGEGAFGKVLLVREKETNEFFAMKLMDKAKFRAQKITSKAVSEQYILKTTRHPFIVGLHYAFQGSTFWALVMDYCPNGDLQHCLGTRGNPGLSLEECARLSGETLLAVEHLHSINVIFRDLKLENVVLDADYRAKVTDFGLAKKLYSTSEARTMCGSYGYAAPEIMLNAERYTYAVDLYSFGVMLYLMLSGGEASPNNPKQRLPPMRHSGLRRRLREAEKEPRAEWAMDSAGGLQLVMMLTSEDPKVRKTASEVKTHLFFNVLGRPVDSLLTERGSFLPGRG